MQATELPWRVIAEEASDGMFVTDAKLRVVWVNRRACELLECEVGDLTGHDISDFFWSTDDLQRDPPRLDELSGGGIILRHRAFRTQRGQQRILEISARSVGDGLILGIARDATVRLETLDRLQRSEASFRALIERSPDGIVVHANGITLYANSAFATMLGFDSPAEVVGIRVLEHIHPDDRSTVASRIQAIRKGEAVPFNEERIIRRDGSALTVSFSGVGITYEGQPAIVAIARDVTAQRSMLAQLAQAEKMVSLGVLSAGVAHEVNNPLAYLTLRLRALATLGEKLEAAVERTRESLVARVGADASAQLVDPGLGAEHFALLADHVATASEGADRVREIVEDLRTFSRADSDAPRLLHVREPLKRALSMVGHHLERGAQVVLDEAETPPILANEGRLIQVFVNLLLNAGQAIAEAPAAQHEVRVRVACENDHVIVAIRDTGVGIRSDNLPRVFEPFFTTKAAGVGTGLGLSICHGIVAALGGTIRVESLVGSGSTFTVAFRPATRE
jgi:PAS domain S-box-containing protein